MNRVTGRRICSLVVAAGIVAATGLTTFAQVKDPFVGTWKLNAAKGTNAQGQAMNNVQVFDKG
jgi:hypothetical protein